MAPSNTYTCNSWPGSSFSSSRTFFGITTWNFGETLTTCMSSSYEYLDRSQIRMSIGPSIRETRERDEVPRVAVGPSASPAEPVHSWSMEAPFKILEHPADIGFQAWGRTQAELFENAALALFSLSCELATVQESES